MKIGKINIKSIAVSGFASVLREYDKMPSQLYIAGKLPNTRIPAVAIVGSRKPTAYGTDVTYKLAYELAQQGVVVISGLAYGIDATAHRAALDAGGITIAVLAGGLHSIYPPQHTALAEEIVRKGGALISELEPGVEARHYHFLARNRLVSGLADAVLVTEAAHKSGTFSTVSHAMSQNKEVFAVPGPITSLLSAGPNRLLQEGVHIALSAEDILHEVHPQAVTTQAQLPLGDTELEVNIIKLIQEGTQEREEVLQAVTAPTSEALQAVTMLELKGVVKTVAGRLHLR